MMNWNEPHTYGELGSALCRLQTKDEAAEFWHGYVGWLSRPDAKLVGGTPEQVAASNIGYLMGYYGPDERQRVYGLFAEFDVSHPIFGRSEPTPDEAFAAGKAWAAGAGKRADG
jgi:hypothetical protein